MNIILCGLPKSGKTTLGKKIAEQLKWNFIDTDQLIENAYERKTAKSYSCRQIFLAEGEGFFRELEKQQISSLKTAKNTVVALGGGSLSDAENAHTLQKCGSIIYLKTPLNILWQRLQANGIPSYLDRRDPENAFYEMAQKRMPLFEAIAKIAIETHHLTEQEIERTNWPATLLEIFLKSPPGENPTAKPLA